MIVDIREDELLVHYCTRDSSCLFEFYCRTSALTLLPKLALSLFNYCALVDCSNPRLILLMGEVIGGPIFYLDIPTVTDIFHDGSQPLAVVFDDLQVLYAVDEIRLLSRISLQ